MKKIDAHSHIGNFGGWAGVAFTKQKLIEQMDEYDIEKTFLTAPNFQGNDEVVDAFQSYPDKIVPFVWVNPALDDVEKKLNHYINEEGFMGIKMQPLFDAFVADDPVVYPVMDFAREYDVPVLGHGHGVYIDAAIKMAKRYDNITLEMSGMPMGSKIKEAYETVGKDIIMFGIDSPFHHPTVEIQKVLSCGLDEKAQEDVFYNNAKKLLRL